jgi:hypothetical protein
VNRKADVGAPPSPSPAGRGKLLAALTAALLTGCTNMQSPRTALSVATLAHGTEDFTLTKPAVSLSGGVLSVEGALCRRFNSIELSPHRILVVGYNPEGRQLFRLVARVAPLVVRSDCTCHRYGARIPNATAPSRIEVSLIPYGGDVPP